MKIEYLNERLIENAAKGKTLLEIALEAKINHAHECGGKARCSTCRVLVCTLAR